MLRLPGLFFELLHLTQLRDQKIQLALNCSFIGRGVAFGNFPGFGARRCFSAGRAGGLSRILAGSFQNLGIQPFPQRLALCASGVLRDFTGLPVNALNAPWNTWLHDPILFSLYRLLPCRDRPMPGGNESTPSEKLKVNGFG